MTYSYLQEENRDDRLQGKWWQWKKQEEYGEGEQEVF